MSAVPPHLMARFNEAKEEFKKSVGLQVDQLFATFLEQIAPVQMGFTQGQSNLVPNGTASAPTRLIMTSQTSSAAPVHHQQIHHQQPQHPQMNTYTQQTLGDIIAAGADADLIHLNALVPGSVGAQVQQMQAAAQQASSATQPSTITINHFGATWEPLQTVDQAAVSQLITSLGEAAVPLVPQTSTTSNSKGSSASTKVVLPIATKTAAVAAVATKSRPGGQGHGHGLQQAGQTFQIQAQPLTSIGDQGSGYSLVPIVVTATTNSASVLPVSGATGPATLATYQLPLVQQQTPQENLNTSSVPETEGGGANSDSLPDWGDSGSDCSCSDCEEGGAEGQQANGDDDTAASGSGPGPAKRSKVKSASSSSNKAYPCKVPGCSLVFPRRHQLKDHRITSHPTASGPEPIGKSFICKHRGCGKMFQSPNHLRRHECIHTNIRPYRCKWDGCTFVAIQRSDAIRHVRVKHFNLPRTFKLQQEQGIEDPRDPLSYVEINR